MELDYYLFKNKIKHKDFAKAVGVHPYRMSLYVNKKANPSLITAIKIYDETKGQVSFKELVRTEDRL